MNKILFVLVLAVVALPACATVGEIISPSPLETKRFEVAILGRPNLTLTFRNSKTGKPVALWSGDDCIEKYQDGVALCFVYLPAGTYTVTVERREFVPARGIRHLSDLGVWRVDPIFSKSLVVPLPCTFARTKEYPFVAGIALGLGETCLPIIVPGAD